jgi:hypothetical protein
MAARTRLLASLALVVVAGAALPAPVLAQAPPPDMPNIDELMRQSGQNGRSPRAASPSSAGVPIPADSPLIAAFQRLESAKSYRVVMEMSMTDPRAQQQFSQMGGMDRYDKLVVKPDTQAVSFHMKIPALYAPGKSDDWEVRAVIKGGKAARKFDTPAKEKILAMQEASMAQQLAQADLSATMSLAQAAAGGPAGLATAGIQLAAVAASHAAAAASLKKSREMFEWTCQDAPAGASATHSGDISMFTDLTDLGERSDGGVPVHGYRFYVHEQGRSHGPVEVDVARGSGLPTRFVMSEPSMGATMVMRYSDYDKPAQIEIPPCLTK